MLKPISTVKVLPKLPAALSNLTEIAHNLRWSWDHAAIELFRRLDADRWETCGHNPVVLLGNVEQSQLQDAANDEAFLAHMRGVAEQFKSYEQSQSTWFHREHARQKEMLVAYFSAEFGITECLSIFAGGLGVLAGDHLKAASDLGIPLVGVGLLYQQGYFRQYLNAAGWQQEAFEDNDFHTLPIRLLPNTVVHLDFPDGTLGAQVWCVNVGRLKLYLLDTNIPSNRPEHRSITNQLYGGDVEMRLRQEIVLGIGGYRALEALGLRPTVYHMNEGHSAFLGLERVLRLMETERLSFQEARLLASTSLIFTTHTPVAAGHDYFSGALMDRYFGEYMRRLGIGRNDFLALGRKQPWNDGEDFCMTVLALRLATASNGVSKLHGEVSRRMWNELWSGIPEAEVPIGHVTNGVHFRSWVSFEMNQLYDRYLGPKWREEPADHKLWQRVDSIPAPELWRTHERRRERLVAYARKRLHEQLIARHAPGSAIDEAEEALSPDALTIGFGRRFATYKRATLLLRDPDRLAKILNHPERPVQIVFAGKAHPQDDEGKHLIETVINLAKRPEFRRKIVFLENYDMGIARYMVQGCDVWLNTPLRPLEASGTSGMKAQANGAINVSTLDGWWDEAWQQAARHDVGWAIGNGEMYANPNYQDEIESEALYQLLERGVVPTFYERRSDGLPMKWIGMMKASIAQLCPEFNMHRAVMQYTDFYYAVMHEHYVSLHDAGSEKARQLAAKLAKLRSSWPRLSVEALPDGTAEIELGDQIHLQANVRLDSLSPEDVSAQALIGRLDAQGEIIDPEIVPMHAERPVDSGSYLFEATTQASNKSGMFGYAIRVVPRESEYLNAFSTNLITWAGPRRNGH